MGCAWRVWFVCVKLKSLFFKELADFRCLWTRPWCVCGDFNGILNLEERSSDSGLSFGLRLFADFVDGQGLCDVPISGTSFTLSNM